MVSSFFVCVHACAYFLISILIAKENLYFLLPITTQSLKQKKVWGVTQLVKNYRKKIVNVLH